MNSNDQDTVTTITIDQSVLRQIHEVHGTLHRRPKSVRLNETIQRAVEELSETVN